MDTHTGTISKRKFVINIAIVLFSNITSVISGILLGLIVPKIMEVSEYGYYKTFTLYASYIGLFGLGFIDGIYLKFAGNKFEDLDKTKFRSYSRFLILMELAIMIIVTSVSFFWYSTTTFIPILFVGLDIFAICVTGYFELIGQITMRFKQTSFRKVIKCTLHIVSIGTLFLLYKFSDYYVYAFIFIAITVAIDYILLLWYLISYREIVFGHSASFKDTKKDIFSFFRIGIVLLLANLVGQFVFVADQQIVNIFFDNETYASYAFAYNMIHLIAVVTNAISIVLYPTLKQLTKESITTNYSKINSYLLIIVSFCMISYFPLVMIVNGFLPKYNDSLLIFRVILPGVLISSSISVIKYNCYKTFDKILNYFVKSLVVLLLAIVSDVVVFYIFKSTLYISIVSIVVLLIWYLLVEALFIKQYKVKWFFNFLYILLILSCFYITTLIQNVFLGTLIYALAFIGLSFLFFGKIIVALFIKKDKKRISDMDNSDQPKEVNESEESN